MDVNPKAYELNGLMRLIQGLDPNSKEYGVVLHRIIRDNIGLAGYLARQFRGYLEFGENNTYLYLAILKAIPKYEHGRGSAPALILEIAKGLILNANRSKLREFAKIRKGSVQYCIDNPNEPSFCCALNGEIVDTKEYSDDVVDQMYVDGYVNEVRYYGREETQD